MEREKFEELVAQAMANLPPEILERLENVDIVVEDLPTQQQQDHAGRNYYLLGLYEGIPLTHRSSGYGMVLPDKITLFKRAIEGICKNDSEIVREIQKTVTHELAHYFGISDIRLKQLEKRHPQKE